MTAAPPPVFTYFPSWVGERDEVVHDDCGICAYYMALDAATLGESDMDAAWHRLDRAETKARREAIRRTLPKDKWHGPLNLNEVTDAFTAFYPGYPPPERWDAPGHGDIAFSMDELFAHLTLGGVAVLQGNPIGAPAKSPLRRWTFVDDFGHFVYLDRARGGSIPKRMGFLMDPMATAPGYRGEWCPWADLEQYAAAFGTKDDRAMAILTRGSLSQWKQAEATLGRQIAVKDKALRASVAINHGLSVDLAAAQVRIAELEALPPADCSDVTAAWTAYADAIAAVPRPA